MWLTMATQIARIYGYVTLADILDLEDEKFCYMDCKYGWTYSVILKGVVELTGQGIYAISLPKFDWFLECVRPAKTPKSSVKQDRPDPEPINITLPSDKLEQNISVLFKDLDKIKDRPVFINIM